MRANGFLKSAFLLLLLLPLVLLSCDQRLPEKKRATPHSKALPKIKADTLAGKKMLLVHSYFTDYPWVESITQGVREVLNDTGVELHVFLMDTKRKTDEAWKVEAGRLAQEKVQVYQPDVVITCDDNAQQYFAMAYADQTLPIVFCGVNADPSKYGFPAANITGIIERPRLNDTVAFGNQITPIKKIAILSSDDPTSRAAVSYMKQTSLNFELLEFRLESDFDAWKKAILNYNETVDAIGIYTYHTLKEKDGSTSLDPEEVMAWTIENATVPTLGFFEFGMNDGLMAGVVESGYEHGKRAARYSLEILKGASAQSLPIVKTSNGVKMVNDKTAAHQGIDLAGMNLESVLVISQD